VEQVNAASEEKIAAEVQAPPFSVGDVVCLKSGGAQLTVIGCSDGEVQAICVSDDGKVERLWLPLVCFQLSAPGAR